jgi:hypothetical protein
LLERRHLPLTPHKGRERHPAQHGLLGLEDSEAQQPGGSDGRLLTLHSDRLDRLQAGGALKKPARILAHQDRPRLGDLLETGRQVGRVPDRRVIPTELVPDPPDHHPPGIHPHADGNVDAVEVAQLGMMLLQALAQAQCGQGRPPDVVFVGDGGPEQGHESVSEELVDGALVAVDLPKGQLEEPVEQQVHGLRPQPLGQ